ncbi:MAG: hypothetical protein LW857_06075 [Verrucomicrobiae bacterium]|jgi:hypothetical protein|nr:hypothetical protein [Verrucomicrobiae bacterium]
MSFNLALSLLGTRELLGAQEIGGGSASVATGYDLSGLRATPLTAGCAWAHGAHAQEEELPEDGTGGG